MVPNRLQELLRLIPKGEWNLQDGINLVDPEGQHFTLTSSELSTLKERLYTELFLEMVSCINEMFENIDHYRRRLEGAFKELNHERERTRIRQAEGIAMALHAIQQIEPEGPTAEVALTKAITILKELINEVSKPRN